MISTTLKRVLRVETLMLDFNVGQGAIEPKRSYNNTSIEWNKKQLQKYEKERLLVRILLHQIQEKYA